MLMLTSRRDNTNTFKPQSNGELTTSSKLMSAKMNSTVKLEMEILIMLILEDQRQ